MISKPGDTPRLYIRADAGPDIGAGHVGRCIALAEAWQSAGAHATLLSVALPDSLREMAELRGITVDLLEGGGQPGSTQDLTMTRDRLTHVAPGDWLVLDGYTFSPDYQQRLRSITPNVLALDDTSHHQRYHVTALLNPNAGADTLNYRVDESSLKLLGPRFALLRSEFAESRGVRHGHPQSARHILIMCGGADKAMLALKLFRSIELSGVADVAVTLIVAARHPGLSEIRAAIAASRLSTCASLCVDPPSVARLMSEADLALATAGVSASELCCMGVPALLFVAAENQASGAASLDRHGAAVNLGTPESMSEEQIGAVFKSYVENPEARARMSLRATALVDGRGAHRVTDVMFALSGLRSVLGDYQLRPLQPADELAVLELANDPDVRSRSLSPEPITRDAHAVWFASVLSDPGTSFWIVTGNSGIVAQIRYTREADDSATVHFAVGSQWRGKGVGTLLLRATSWPAITQLGVTRIRAVVIEGNAASARAFIKAGYQQTNVTSIKSRQCEVYELA